MGKKLITIKWAHDDEELEIYGHNFFESFRLPWQYNRSIDYAIKQLIDLRKQLSVIIDKLEQHQKGE